MISEGKVLSKDTLEEAEYFFNTIKEDDVYDPQNLENTLYDITNLSNLILFDTDIEIIDNPYLQECPESTCHKNIREIIEETDFKDTLSALKNHVKRGGDKESRTNQCKAAIASESFGDYESGQVAKEIPEILDNITKNALKGFSEESKQAYRNFINNDLDFDSGAEDMDIRKNKLSNLLYGIEQDYKRMKSEKGKKDDISSNSFDELILKYYTSIKSGNQIDSQKYLYRCNYKFADKPIVWDYFQTPSFINNDRAKIAISMFSDLHLAHGKAITAHEMGHALSYFAGKSGKFSKLSQNKFKEIRQCISETHQYDTNKARWTHHSTLSEHQYVEEDMADSIAFAAYNDKQLHECAFLDKEHFDNGYFGLSLKNRYASDPHSSSFLRVLREAVNKNIEMPRSCQKLIDRAKNEFRFKKCI